VFVSPSSLLRVALKHRVTLPGEPVRPRPVLPAMPQVPWERNRIWIWDATHFPRAKRVAYAIVDVVTRYWIGYLLTTEQTSTQAQLLFARWRTRTSSTLMGFRRASRMMGCRSWWRGQTTGRR
jgi:putative transposase